MPWEPPIFKTKALGEFYRKVEKIPDPLPQPYYDPPMTYFNNAKCSLASFAPYDLFYNFEEGFDPKSARDDRKSLPIIFENIFKEEEYKYIPVTSQLWYGRPLLHEKILDWSNRHGKPNATREFYRRQGINITPELEQQLDH